MQIPHHSLVGSNEVRGVKLVMNKMVEKPGNSVGSAIAKGRESY